MACVSSEKVMTSNMGQIKYGNRVLGRSYDMKLYIRACWHTDFHKLGLSLEIYEISLCLGEPLYG